MVIRHALRGALPCGGLFGTSCSGLNQWFFVVETIFSSQDLVVSLSTRPSTETVVMVIAFLCGAYFIF